MTVTEPGRLITSELRTDDLVQPGRVNGLAYTDRRCSRPNWSGSSPAAGCSSATSPRCPRPATTSPAGSGSTR